VSRVYWDPMLFIYWLEENPQFGKRVDAIWLRMQERNDQLITGALALGEVLAGAYKRGANKERIQEVKAATCDVRPGRRPHGPALLELVVEPECTFFSFDSPQLKLVSSSCPGNTSLAPCRAGSFRKILPAMI